MKKSESKDSRLSIFKMKINKKGIISDYLPWLLIAVAVLAIVAISIFVLKGKGISLVDQLKNLFKS